MLLPLGFKSLYQCHEWLMSQVCCSDVAKDPEKLQSQRKYDLCHVTGNLLGTAGQDPAFGGMFVGSGM